MNTHRDPSWHAYYYDVKVTPPFINPQRPGPPTKAFIQYSLVWRNSIPRESNPDYSSQNPRRCPLATLVGWFQLQLLWFCYLLFVMDSSHVFSCLCLHSSSTFPSSAVSGEWPTLLLLCIVALICSVTFNPLTAPLIFMSSPLRILGSTLEGLGYTSVHCEGF